MGREHEREREREAMNVNVWKKDRGIIIILYCGTNTHTHTQQVCISWQATVDKVLKYIYVYIYIILVVGERVIHWFHTETEKDATEYSVQINHSVKCNTRESKVRERERQTAVNCMRETVRSFCLVSESLTGSRHCIDCCKCRQASALLEQKKSLGGRNHTVPS